MNKFIKSFFIPVLLTLISCVPLVTQTKTKEFNGTNAYDLIIKQLSFGPKFPGSPGHQKEVEWIEEQLLKLGWQVKRQYFNYKGLTLTNLIAHKDSSNNPIILGTHFDTRRFADHDPIIQNRNLHVPGANDGASGVAVLLELARILADDKNHFCWLVFFDREDQGNTSDWDWIQGSSYFVSTLEVNPKSAIIIDMIGDRQLNIYSEGFSNKTLQVDIWREAFELGFGEHFISENKYFLIDDHKPFIDKGIPSVLLIDFDYPYWHTTQDTLDKISSESLKMVGSTLLKWIYIQ